MLKYLNQHKKESHLLTIEQLEEMEKFLVDVQQRPFATSFYEKSNVFVEKCRKLEFREKTFEFFLSVRPTVAPRIRSNKYFSLIKQVRREDLHWKNLTSIFDLSRKTSVWSVAKTLQENNFVVRRRFIHLHRSLQSTLPGALSFIELLPFERILSQRSVVIAIFSRWKSFGIEKLSQSHRTLSGTFETQFVQREFSFSRKIGFRRKNFSFATFREFGEFNHWSSNEQARSILRCSNAQNFSSIFSFTPTIFSCCPSKFCVNWSKNLKLISSIDRQTSNFDRFDFLF